MKRYVTPLLVIVALTFGMPASVDAGKEGRAYKLDGAWVAKVVDSPGQWSYVITSDASGRHAYGHGSVDVGLNLGAILGPVFEPADSDSPILINITKTGPDTASYYSIWYGLKDLDPSSPATTEIVVIGVVTGELRFVAPGKINGIHNFAMYFPWQDGDGDGFPDEGEFTPYVFQLATVDTRLPMPE